MLWESIWQSTTWWLGLDVDDLNFRQMAVRAVVVYTATLLMVRVGQKRFFGRNTAFDLILGIILGSVVSRAINGSAAFFPTLGTGFVLIGLHWLLATIAFYTHGFGVLVKGRKALLVKNGEIQWEAMRQGRITERDLMLALRTQVGSDDLDQVREAYLERSGEITVLTQRSEPRIIEVDVEPGVQTVRIRLE